MSEKKYSIMSEKKYSITTSNFKKIIQVSKIQIDEDITTIFRSIYDEVNLRPYLNDLEAKDIRKITEFLLNPEMHVSAIEKQKVANQGQKAMPSRSNYIFISSSSKPKYHKDTECKTLLNDFENFRIPQEIKDKGEEEISKFRSFARENQALLKNGKEELFIQKLRKEFNLASDIDKVSFNNSGKIEVSKMSTPNIKENISALIKKLEGIRESDEGRISIQNHMFTPGNMIDRIKRNPKLSLRDLEVLEIKKSLLDLITEFNMQKNNGRTLSENILEFYGFEKCGVCFSDEIRYDL